MGRLRRGLSPLRELRLNRMGLRRAYFKLCVMGVETHGRVLVQSASQCG